MKQISCVAIRLLVSALCMTAPAHAVHAAASLSSTSGEHQDAGAALEARGVQLDAYVDCFNKTAKPAYDSIKRYVSWIDDRVKGPSGKEKVVDGVGRLDPVLWQNCGKQLAQLDGTSSGLADLHEAALAYVKALAEMGTSVNEAQNYYDRKGYTRDKFAKARAMHGPLRQKFQVYMRAKMALHDELETETARGYREDTAWIESNTKTPVLDVLLSYFSLQIPGMVPLLVQNEFNVEERYKIRRMATELARCEKILVDGSRYDEAHPSPTTEAQAQARRRWAQVSPTMRALVAAAGERLKEIQAMPLTGAAQPVWLLEPPGAVQQWVLHGDGSADEKASATAPESASVVKLKEVYMAYFEAHKDAENLATPQQ